MDYSTAHTFAQPPAPPAPPHDPLAAVLFFVIFIAFYVYLAYSLQIIAKRTGTPNAWMAWVPVLNVYLMLKIAGKPGWWLLWFFIPLVNVIVSLVVWYELAKRLGRSGGLGVLVGIFPFLIGILAFGNAPAPLAPPSPPDISTPSAPPEQ